MAAVGIELETLWILNLYANHYIAVVVMQAIRGRESKLRICSWRISASTPALLSPRTKPRYPQNRRLTGPQLDEVTTRKTPYRCWEPNIGRPVRNKPLFLRNHLLPRWYNSVFKIYAYVKCIFRPKLYANCPVVYRQSRFSLLSDICRFLRRFNGVDIFKSSGRPLGYLEINFDIPLDSVTGTS
jgi:hypothetical protein